mmetsp:Transcript_19923/g.19234  ORF Transcript_19923/g.19234 Transcript_19923/m.19234 type:complete len:233 (+) Transcript_19923:1856-2554(+)
MGHLIVHTFFGQFLNSLICIIPPTISHNSLNFRLLYYLQTLNTFLTFFRFCFRFFLSFFVFIIYDFLIFFDFNVFTFNLIFTCRYCLITLYLPVILLLLFFLITIIILIIIPILIIILLIIVFITFFVIIVVLFIIFLLLIIFILLVLILNIATTEGIIHLIISDSFPFLLVPLPSIQSRIDILIINIGCHIHSSQSCGLQFFQLFSSSNGLLLITLSPISRLRFDIIQHRI